MRIKISKFIVFGVFCFVVTSLCGQQSTAPQSSASQSATAKPEDTEVWQPVPKVVDPGADCNAAPSDAIILFDGKNLDQWVSSKDKSPAKWTVSDGVITVNKSAGNIETKRHFRDYQLHIEWKVPENITGSGQAGGIAAYFSPLLVLRMVDMNCRSSIRTRTRLM